MRPRIFVTQPVPEPAIDVMRAVGDVEIYPYTDRMISIDLLRVLHDPLLVPGGHDVSGEVADGVVRLSGTVTRPSHGRMIAAAVRELPGVIEVDDRQVSVELSAVPTADRAPADR